MTLRFHSRLAAIALVGLAVCSGDPRGAAAEEHERRSRPAPTVPSAGRAAGPAHAPRIARAKPATPRRPDRPPRLKKPRLGQEPGTRSAETPSAKRARSDGSASTAPMRWGSRRGRVPAEYASVIRRPCPGRNQRPLSERHPVSFPGALPVRSLRCARRVATQRYFRSGTRSGEGAVRPRRSIFPISPFNFSQMRRNSCGDDPARAVRGNSGVSVLPARQHRRERIRPADVQPLGAPARVYHRAAI